MDYLEYVRQLNLLSITIGSVKNDYALSIVGTTTLDQTLRTYVVCDPSRNEKYSAGACSVITAANCANVLTTMNANSCLTDNVPLTCLNNYYYKADYTACLATCPVGSIRSPWSNTTNSDCDKICPEKSNCNNQQVTVPNTVSLKDGFTCKTGYSRYGYNCILNENAKNGNNIIITKLINII